jgi:hypothetical protein
MEEDRFEMGQRERDRLKVLHEASKGQITQKRAGEQLKMSVRQVRRLIGKLKLMGDRAVVHGLAGRQSNRRVSEEVVKRCLAELGKPECLDFGPTFAAEHLGRKLDVKVGRDTVRKWMVAEGLWESQSRRVRGLHQWRERRHCSGELVQWDTSVHDWLEGRGERLYLIGMIDDATSRLVARFALHDTAEENMRVVRVYLTRYGRPLEFYTDKAGMFETTPKKPAGRDGEVMAPTQITRALAELGISRCSAHSPQAKGRIERCFQTLQDRLVKEFRLAGIATLEQANAYLEDTFLPDWNRRFTLAPANATDAHRALTELHNLDSSLSHVEQRRVNSDYTLQFRGQRYQIGKTSVSAGLKGQFLRVEARLDGSIAVRHQGRFLEIELCGIKPPATAPSLPAQPIRKDHNRGGRSTWMKNFDVTDTKPSRWPVRRDSMSPT